MLKIFFFGILLGIAAAAGALYAMPAVDQKREASIISVAANGGTTESFRINVPTDRIMFGAAGQSEPLPAGMIWPTDELLQDIRAELFKIRDARDSVIGVAARTTATDGDTNVIDWVIHLPARGTMFLNLDTAAETAGYRSGNLRAGSREFSKLKGFLSERWVPNNSDQEGAPDGHIELKATYIGAAEPEDQGE